MDNKTKSLVTIVICIVVIALGIGYQFSNAGEERTSLFETIEDAGGY